jgi:hypothetical protein
MQDLRVIGKHGSSRIEMGLRLIDQLGSQVQFVPMQGSDRVAARPDGIATACKPALARVRLGIELFTESGSQIG